jgi:hypothetical protein
MRGQPSPAATKPATTHVNTPFLTQYRFHIDPTQDDEHVLMTQALSANNKATIEKEMTEEKSARDVAATTKKTTGSPTTDRINCRK